MEEDILLEGLKDYLAGNGMSTHIHYPDDKLGFGAPDYTWVNVKTKEMRFAVYFCDVEKGILQIRSLFHPPIKAHMIHLSDPKCFEKIHKYITKWDRYASDHL